MVARFLRNNLAPGSGIATQVGDSASVVVREP